MSIVIDHWIIAWRLPPESGHFDPASDLGAGRRCPLW